MPSGAPRATLGRRLLEGLVHLQAMRPFAVLAVAFLTTLLAGLAASRLELKTSLDELLPANKESVLVADQVKKRLISSSTLYIVAESHDTEALKRFVDALGPELRALPPGAIGAVDDGVREALAFFEKHQLLYAPLKDVEEVHDEIVLRYEREVSKAAGFDLGLDDEARSSPAVPLTADGIKRQIEARRGKAVTDRFPGGYYLAPEGDLIVVLVRTPVSAGDLEGTQALLAQIRGAVDRVGPARFAPDLQITFSGNLIFGAEEYARIKGDLTHVGLLGVGMILGVVFLFYLRVRPLLAMALSVGIGVVWTFGLAYVLIGHLNASTGFLTSIIVGNGINFGIIYMTRYFEVRPGNEARQALLTAHLDTSRATLAAAFAASVAYGSLIVTDFRGFKHFGVIGGTGMILCWAATYLFLPSILIALERASAAVSAVASARLPGPTAAPSRLSALFERLRGSYGRPFASLAERFPRAILAAAAVSGLGAAALTVHYFASDPMEYDLNNTLTQPEAKQASALLRLERVQAICGQGQDGLAIMVDRIDQVRPLRAALDAKRAAASPGREPFERVADIFDFLPQDQDRKLTLIAEARDRIERAHLRGVISDADFAEVKRLLPEDGLRPLGVADLPEQVARLFTEADGTRGRFVYIVPTTGRSVFDGRYLLDWADSFRRTTLPDGSVIRGSGNAVIFADVLLTVVEDAPKAILVSLLATLAIIAVAFPRRGPKLAVLGTLALGLVWMMAALALSGARVTLPPDGPLGVTLVGLKLNFLNFIAIPISIGVGADYAINIMQRAEVERGSVRDVIRSTGGAVILCSLTTTLGYLGLTFSINRATKSFGVSAAAGEVSCLLAAVLVLPAFLVWRERKRSTGALR